MSKSVNVPIQNIHYYSEEAGSSNNEEEPATYVKEEQVYERSGSIAMEDAYGETEDVIEIAPETPQETILNFFLCMGHTCSLFSPMLQAQIKREVFEIISNAEIMNLENTDS